MPGHISYLKEEFTMKHYFEKVACLFLTVLTSISLCIHPVNLPDKPNEPGISICSAGGNKEEVDLPPFPLPPKPH